MEHFKFFKINFSNVNVDRFARNDGWDFSCDFQTPWGIKISINTCLIQHEDRCEELGKFFLLKVA